MSFGGAQGRERVGRPTQFHSVSTEERAFDSSGNRLPWALEFPDGHPNARLARKQPEEKGSFGRSARRNKTGSTRGTTRTQTPAAKEINSSLKGFEQALQFDTERAPPVPQQQQQQQSQNQQQQQQQQQQAPGADSPAPTQAATEAPAEDAEPTYVTLSGFSSDSQWAAIQFYEAASGGIICEDYDREPPDERRRWHGAGLISHGGSASSRHARRALTAKEARMAMQFRGGAHWVRVTFDSKATADRAIAASPHILAGHWVAAAAWKGKGPDKDEPVLLSDDDRTQPGSLSTPRPASRSFSRSMPGTPTSPVMTSMTGRKPSMQSQNIDESPLSSSTTASSGTATGPEIGGGELRQRHTAGLNDVAVEEDVNAMSLGRFPAQGRVAFKPVADALLPTQTFSERLWKWLTDMGLVPKDIIGSTVPRKDNDTGDFDWDTASYYWRFVKWLDDTLGTDLCGMKDA